MEIYWEHWFQACIATRDPFPFLIRVVVDSLYAAYHHLQIHAEFLQTLRLMIFDSMAKCSILEAQIIVPGEEIVHMERRITCVIVFFGAASVV